MYRVKHTREMVVAQPRKPSGPLARPAETAPESMREDEPQEVVAYDAGTWLLLAPFEIDAMESPPRCGGSWVLGLDDRPRPNHWI